MSAVSRRSRASRPGLSGPRWPPPGRCGCQTDRVRTRALVCAAALCNAAAVAVSVWLTMRPGGAHLEELPGAVISDEALVGLAWALTGSVLAWLRPRNPLGWLLVIAWDLRGVLGRAAGVRRSRLLDADPPWPLARWAAWLGSALWLPGLLPLANLRAGAVPARPPARSPLALAGCGGRLSGSCCSPSRRLLDPTLLRRRCARPPVAVVRAGTRSGPVPRGRGHAGARHGGDLGDVARAARAVPAAGAATAGLALRGGRCRCSCWSSFRACPSGFGDATLYLIPVAVGRRRLSPQPARASRSCSAGAWSTRALTALVVTVYLAVTVVAGTRLDRDPLPGVVAAALVAVALTPLRERLQRGRRPAGVRRTPGPHERRHPASATGSPPTSRTCCRRCCAS